MHFLYRRNDACDFIFTRLLCTVYIISVYMSKDDIGMVCTAGLVERNSMMRKFTHVIIILLQKY